MVTLLPHIGTLERNRNEAIALPPNQLKRHCWVGGKSGTGKSTLLRNMMVANLYSGDALTLLDPHGSLYDDVLSAIPRCRTNDVILIDPAHHDGVVGFNILESVDPGKRHLVVSSVVKIFSTLWRDSWGARSDWLLRNCLYALLEQPEPATLAALPKLLTHKQFRADVVSHVTDPAIRMFFESFERQNERFRDEVITPLLNKVSIFIENPLLRAVTGQPRSTFDWRWAMDHSKCILANLSKGALGSDVSSLLGSLIVSKLALTSLSREDIPEADRKLHILYADEVQNFTHGVDFPLILSESRKYGLALVIASQTLSQLSEDSVAAIFGNAGTIITFRVSGDDAKALVREFAVSGEGPKTSEETFDVIIPASRLQDLPDYKAYVRRLLNGAPHEPELVSTFPPFPNGWITRNLGRIADPRRVERMSLGRFGRERAKVEAELRRFLEAP